MKADKNKKSLCGRSLLSVRDLDRDEVERILSLAAKMKKNRGKCDPETLRGKFFSLYFEKPSLRTRTSFEVAISELGGRCLYMDAHTTHAERGESIADMARVLSRYVHGIIYRSNRHQDLEDMALHASVPVINALSDFTHPCQALTDVFTILERKDRSAPLKLAYVGDGNNVAHSLIWTCAKVGINFTAACPHGYEPEPFVLKEARQIALDSGAEISICHKPSEAVSGADVVYTDVWISMGQETETARRRKAFKEFRVNRKLMEAAKPDALFMHDLPAHRGEEVTAAVMDGPQSVVFDQAENRLHVQKAIMALIFGPACDTKKQ